MPRLREIKSVSTAQAKLLLEMTPKGLTREEEEMDAKMARALIHQKVVKRLGAIIDAQIDAAIGLKCIDDKNGQVYQRPPDSRAAALLLDRTLGKVKEEMPEEIKRMIILRKPVNERSENSGDPVLGGGQLHTETGGGTEPGGQL